VIPVAIRWDSRGHRGRETNGTCRLPAVCGTDHRRPAVRPARARPPGRAQQAELDRRAGERTTRANHTSAGAAGALIH
jgi:hypothetical protein